MGEPPAPGEQPPGSAPPLSGATGSAVALGGRGHLLAGSSATSTPTRSVDAPGKRPREGARVVGKNVQAGATETHYGCGKARRQCELPRFFAARDRSGASRANSEPPATIDVSDGRGPQEDVGHAGTPAKITRAPGACREDATPAMKLGAKGGDNSGTATPAKLSSRSRAGRPGGGASRVRWPRSRGHLLDA